MQIFKKNPIYLNEYKTEDRFNLFEAKREWIIFRNQFSSHMYPGQSALQPTVDLILVGVMYFEMPFEFNGFVITKPKDKLARKYSEEFDRNGWLEAGERVYSIASEGKRFNIVTSNLWIHIHNGQNHSESPIEHLYYGSIKGYDYYLENVVKDWIKIN